MDPNAAIALPPVAAPLAPARGRRRDEWTWLRRAAGYLPHNDLIPRLRYRWKFATQCQSSAATPARGFSLVMATRNRREFLACAVEAVLSSTREPFELLLMDNASEDGSSELCAQFAARNPGVVRHVRLGRNFGTNAYALGFLEARHRYLVDMDDDILALSQGWDQATLDAFEAFPRLGFLAMNVVQDGYTDGAKKGRAEYTDVTRAHTTLEVGPTGGWFSVTTREIYNRVGGFVFRPHKPFPAEDGKYVRTLSRHGYFAGILKNAYVYHASGPYWNAAYGYGGIWNEKYRRDHRERLSWVREVRVDAVPSFQYAARKVCEAQGTAAFEQSRRVASLR